VITGLESSQRGYLLTGQTGYLEPYHVAMRSWRKQIDRLRELTVDDPNRLADITSLEGLTTAAVSRLEQTIRSSPQPGPNGNADVAGTDRATQTMDRVRGVVDRMMSEEDSRIEASRREVLRDMWVGAGVAVLATVVTVAVLIALNKLLQRYVRDRESALRALRQANQHLNHVVEQRTAELTELSQHLIRVSEEEKAKLARELHDTLGSNLTAINMDLNWIQRRLPETPREVRERLQRVLQMLADTVELKHEVIEGLRPSHLDNLGLAFAMRSLSRVHAPHRAPLRYRVHEGLRRSRSSWSIAFYRIVRRRSTNITKHAQATQVDQPGSRAGGLRLRIRTTGSASPTRPSPSPNRTVVGMRERMREMGGASRSAGRPAAAGQSWKRSFPIRATRLPALRRTRLTPLTREGRRERNRAMSGTFRHRHAVVSPEGPRTAYRGDRYGKPDDRDCSSTRRARVSGA
jgi:signal transduction histidine kinase